MFKVKVYMLIVPDKPELYKTYKEALSEAENIEYMQQGEVIVEVVEVNAAGEEID